MSLLLRLVLAVVLIVIMIMVAVIMIIEMVVVIFFVRWCVRKLRTPFQIPLVAFHTDHGNMVRCEHVWAKSSVIFRPQSSHVVYRYLGARIDAWGQSEPSPESWMWIQIPSCAATVFGRNKVG